MAIPIGSIVQAVFKPKRSIGDITAMVTIEELHNDEVFITEHPVEYGASVSDHAFVLPYELRIKLGWSKSPNLTASGFDAILSAGKNLASAVTGSAVYDAIIGPGGFSDYLQTVYKSLINLQQKFEPFSIYTGKRIYQNMLIKSLSVSTNADTENSLMVELICRQVIIVNTVTTQASKANQKMPQKTGSASNNGTVQPIQR